MHGQGQCSDSADGNKILIIITIQVAKYRMWENFGGGKFWRINGSKVFGEEKFGKSVGTILKILAFINIGGENFGELPTVRQIFPLQNFPMYGIINIAKDFAV